jgi:DNA processing protein
MSDEIVFTIALSMIAGINDVDKKRILELYGSAVQVFKEHQKQQNGFSELNLFYKNILMATWPLKEAEAEFNFITKHQIKCITVLDSNYPNRLVQCKDAPLLLYVKGSDQFNLPQLISIVGTRQPTVQVAKIVQELMEGLAHLKIGIVSGLALGVDGIVHQTALKMNLPTWGVLAHGLDKIYPNEHRRLAIEMIQQGGLLTECKKSTIPLPYFFPKRNRIVAGMSDATVVIETAIKGGSMITASLAFDYNREVFAVPGKIYDPKSKGCLHLIKYNKAHVYHDPSFLLENMNWPIPDLPIIEKQLKLLLDPELQRVLLYIEMQGPVHRDTLANQLKINASMLSGYLLSLEIQGHIHLMAGNLYCKL